MPYGANSISQARKDIPNLKNLSDSQVKRFIKIFNSLVKDGMAENKAIPIAISRSKKDKVDKATTKDVTRDDKGNLVYRGEKFAGYNKPMRDSGKKQGKVLAKKGDEIKLVRFGDPSMKDNYSVEANDNFYARFGKRPEINDKFSPLYWSASYLWPRGSMKGKGAKEFYTLNKSAKETQTMKSSFVEGLASLINKHFGSANNLQQIVKFNEEQMIAIEPLYCKPLEADLHEEGMTEEEIRKMVDNINENITKISGNIGHAINTEGFHFVKAWVNECDCIIGDEIVPEGQPIIKVQFSDEKLWELRKSGKLQGLSIGALGHVVDNPDYKEEVDDSEAA